MAARREYKDKIGRVNPALKGEESAMTLFDGRADTESTVETSQPRSSKPQPRQHRPMKGRRYVSVNRKKKQNQQPGQTSADEDN